MEAMLPAHAGVTDVGGPPGHGSIATREQGVPAVLGTGKATWRIHSDQVHTAVDQRVGALYDRVEANRHDRHPVDRPDPGGPDRAAS